MKNSSVFAVLSFFAILMPVLPAPVAAQIDIAALARFKYNQQHALAASLSKTQVSKEKSHRSKSQKTAITGAAAKPPVIFAHNRTFKSNYGDMHTKNVR